MLKKIFSSELPSRNNAGETIKPASVAGNELTRKYWLKSLVIFSQTRVKIGYHGNSLGPWWPKSIPNDVR